MTRNLVSHVSNVYAAVQAGGAHVAGIFNNDGHRRPNSDLLGPIRGQNLRQDAHILSLPVHCRLRMHILFSQSTSKGRKSSAAHVNLSPENQHAILAADAFVRMITIITMMSVPMSNYWQNHLVCLHFAEHISSCKLLPFLLLPLRYIPLQPAQDPSLPCSTLITPQMLDHIIIIIVVIIITRFSCLEARCVCRHYMTTQNALHRFGTQL